jgi:hypothetical protein
MSEQTSFKKKSNYLFAVRGIFDGEKIKLVEC